MRHATHTAGLSGLQHRPTARESMPKPIRQTVRQHLNDGRSQVIRPFEPDEPWGIAFKIDDLNITMSHWLSMLRVVDRRQPPDDFGFDANRSAFNSIAHDLED